MPDVDDSRHNRPFKPWSDPTSDPIGDVQRMVENYGKPGPSPFGTQMAEGAPDRPAPDVMAMADGVMTKHYVIARTVEQVRRWSIAEENMHIPLKDMVALFTDRAESVDKLRGRVVMPGDQLVRLGDYDQGAFWHDIEDELQLADRNGVWG